MRVNIPLRLASSFGAQAVVALLGIASVPAYLALLGQEAYGLIGLHVTVQTWMILMDMGLPTAMARKLSVWQAGTNSEDVAPFIKAVERVFWLTAVLAMVAMVGASPWIAQHWLAPSEVQVSDVTASLRLMAGMVALRWTASLYQAALIGLERQNFVNAVVVASTLARTAVAMSALMLVGPRPQYYFLVHLLGALCDVLVLRSALSGIVPWHGAATLDLREAAADLKLAGGFVVVTVVWLAASQTDKIVLSHTLPLKDFGLFSIVSAICTGVATLVPAFTQAVQPRLTALLTQRRRSEFVRLYRVSTALLLAVTASLAATVAAFPATTLYAWTGSATYGWNVATVLCLYVTGTGLANMVLAPFLLQYASGDMRVHVRTYAALGAVWIPAALWATYTHGPWGGGVVWLVGNVALLSACWSVAHGCLLSTAERSGMNKSIFAQVAMLAVAAMLLSAIMPPVAGRMEAFVALACVSAAILLVGILASGDLRLYGRQWYASLRLDGWR